MGVLGVCSEFALFFVLIPPTCLLADGDLQLFAQFKTLLNKSMVVHRLIHSICSKSESNLPVTVHSVSSRVQKKS